MEVVVTGAVAYWTWVQDEQRVTEDADLVVGSLPYGIREARLRANIGGPEDCGDGDRSRPGRALNPGKAGVIYRRAGKL